MSAIEAGAPNKFQVAEASGTHNGNITRTHADKTKHAKNLLNMVYHVSVC